MENDSGLLAYAMSGGCCDDPGVTEEAVSAYVEGHHWSKWRSVLRKLRNAQEKLRYHPFFARKL